METQLSNLLQSLFETDGEKFFKTPTFYVMKMFREHLGQHLTDVLPDDTDADLDTVATASEDGNSITVSIVNRHLYDSKKISLDFKENNFMAVRADIVTSDDVRAVNTFDEPTLICEREFVIDDISNITVPAHSIVRICFKKN